MANGKKTRVGFKMKYLILLIVLFSLSGRYAIDRIASSVLYPFGSMKVETLVPTPGIDYITTTYGDLDVFHYDIVGVPMVYFHGNGINYSGMYNAKFFNMFQSMGLATYAYDYPGQPGTKGKPSEKSLVETALKVFDLAYEEYNQPIIIWGRSLGAAVAAQVAAKRPDKVLKLVLVSPWTSFSDAGKSNFLFKYVSEKFKKLNKYESLKALKDLNIKTLIIHGDKDKLIDISHSKKIDDVMLNSFLYEAKGLGHNDLYGDPQTINVINSFVK